MRCAIILFTFYFWRETHSAILSSNFILFYSISCYLNIKWVNSLFEEVISEISWFVRVILSSFASYTYKINRVCFRCLRCHIHCKTINKWMKNRKKINMKWEVIFNILTTDLLLVNFYLKIFFKLLKISLKETLSAFDSTNVIFGWMKWINLRCFVVIWI
jgi:hypothetical protein